MKTRLLILISIALWEMHLSANACTTPGIISGPSTVCIGKTINLTDPTLGGTWSSNNIAIATVGTAGIVTGMSTGATTITYSTGVGCYSVMAITVDPLPLPIVGATDICQTLTTTLTDATPGGMWVSDFPAIASVGPLTGIVTGIAPSGGTPVRYILPTGCQSLSPIFISVHIPPAPVTGTNVMCQGSGDTLNISFPAGGTWSSSAPVIASVTDLGYPYGGLVLGVNGGTAIISYTIVSCPPSVDTVTINPLPAPIDGLTSICIGLPISLADSTAGGTWTSSDATVATIDPATGVVTVLTTVLGLTTVITYTLPTGCLINTQVTTNAAPDNITGPGNVCQGSFVTLADATPGGTWSSTVLATAQVIDSSGVVYGIIAGMVNISYTLASGCYATVPFTVDPPIPATVSVTQTPNGTICAGTPIVFRATTTNAGMPTFQWLKFFTGFPMQTFDSLLYTSPTHGDVIVIQVVTHGVCALKDTVYDTVAINVYPDIATPFIAVTTNDTFNKISDSSNYLWFPGQVITFYSNVTYGGSIQTFQWYENGAPIPGANGSSYSATVYQNDTFYCVVTGNPPCDIAQRSVSNKMYIYGNYLSVNTLPSGSGLTLFPNPNNGGFTLSGTMNPASNDNLNIEVCDMLGNIVYSGNTIAQNGMVHEQINLDNKLASGTYVLKIGSSAENQVLHFVVGK